MLLFHLSKGLVADKIIEEESSLEEDEEDNQEPEVDVTQLTWRKNKLFELRLNMVSFFFNTHSLKSLTCLQDCFIYVYALVFIASLQGMLRHVPDCFM